MYLYAIASLLLKKKKVNIVERHNKQAIEDIHLANMLDLGFTDL